MKKIIYRLLLVGFLVLASSLEVQAFPEAMDVSPVEGDLRNTGECIAEDEEVENE